MPMQLAHVDIRHLDEIVCLVFIVESIVDVYSKIIFPKNS